jgi:hypothetical protein
MLHLYRDAADTPEGRNSVPGSVTRTIFYGDSLYYEVDIGAAGSLDVRVENLPAMKRWDVGDRVIVDFHPQAATALEA